MNAPTTELRGIKVAARMPSKYHTLPGHDFALHRSEVVAWLVRQPEIQQWVFNIASGRKLITYDPDTGLWKGREAR